MDFLLLYHFHSYFDYLDYLTQAAFQALVKLVIPLRKTKTAMPLERLLHTVKV